MAKFQFKGTKKKKKKKRGVPMYTILTGKPVSTPVASSVGKYRFKGQTKGAKRQVSKKKMNEFADCLIDIHKDWSSLEEGKADAMACLEQLLKEVRGNQRAKREIRRAQLNISRIESLKSLISYCYQLKLKLSGMSVNRVLRGK